MTRAAGGTTDLAVERAVGFGSVPRPRSGLRSGHIGTCVRRVRHRHRLRWGCAESSGFAAGSATARPPAPLPGLWRGAPGVSTVCGVTLALLRFPGSVDSVSEARHFLTATLATWGADGYDMGAQVVVTELAANAALHARTDYLVRLQLEETHLLVEVHDAVPDLPQVRSVSPESMTGRGLRLVEELSLTWGAFAHEDAPGKVVWAHVPPDSLDALTVLFDDLDVDGVGDLDAEPDIPAQGDPRRAAAG
jgi:anti-sigma regulatory factor (Ser/Thr protein kinase)